MINVDFNQLSQASDDLRSTSTKIKAELDELEGKLNKLAETWDGHSRDEYKNAQAKWDAAANEMIEIAAKMGVAVRTANDAYQAGEKKNAGRFSG